MLKLTISLFILVSTGFSFPRAQETSNGISRFFKHLITDNNFKSTYISNKMFETIMKTRKEELDDETRSILKDLTSLHVLTSERHNPGEQYREAIPKINTSEYPLLFSKQDQVDKFSLFTRKSGAVITEILLVARDHTDFVILSITGKIDLEKITRLASILHFQGSEFLEQMNLSEDSLRKLHIPGNKRNRNE